MQRVIRNFVAGCAIALLPGFTRAFEVRNPSFELGGKRPEAWTLSEGIGQRRTDGAADGKAYITVTGNGKSMNYWRSAPVGFKPGKLYRVAFQAKAMGMSSGTPVSGPVFCNVDLWSIQEKWQPYSFVCVAPDNLGPDTDWLRFGQWHVRGTVAFDAIRVTKVQPVYRHFGERDALALGTGESVNGNEYVFEAPFTDEGRNHSRPLARTTAGYNTSRWVFGAGSEVVYRHVLGKRMQLAGTLEITVNYHTGGALVVEASRDGGAWREVGIRKETGTLTATLPADLFPARELRVRLRAQARQTLGAGDSDPGSFQVNNYRYQATFSGPPVRGRGQTRYVEITATDPRVDVRLESLGDGIPGGDNTIRTTVINRTKKSLATCLAVILSRDGKKYPFQAGVIRLRPGENRVAAAYQIPDTGRWKIEIALRNGVTFRALTSFFVPEFYNASYGERLPGSQAGIDLWWTSSGWKIPRTRNLPGPSGKALRIQAAANEAEAAQLVLRPTRPLRRLVLTPEALRGPGAFRIMPENIDILEVRYVPVSRKTDATGVLADWPDPLPPLTAPIDLRAGLNQPFWVRVRVPAGTPAGTYRGPLRLRAEGWKSTVMIEVRVYGFELPKRMTCQTAFGVSTGNIWRYQKLTDPAQQRLVLEKYWKNYSAHHISPYDPAPLDHFRVNWPGTGNWQGGFRDRENAARGVSSLRVADDSKTNNVSAHFVKLIPIPKKGFRLRFRYKTAPPEHEFIVTLNHHDANGQWMSGRNNDMHIKGNGTWQSFDRVIDRFPENARFVKLTLWATRYAEDGHYTGTVWYDDLTLTDLDTGKNVVPGGDFEPLPKKNFTPRIDWEAWDRAMTRAVEVYGFNSVRLPVMGLGGGTFHSRREPSLLGYGEDTPEYQAAMKAYLGRLEDHLRRKGWLDEAYVYWFDEPSPKDYEFVMNGFRKLKRWAPGLRRMLTEQVEDALIGGPNLWCPVSSRFDLKRAEERRAAGDSFWWYICTGPKAPYCTLFIDHPATELRVWLWQTWKRRIKGILVWQSTYWTSSCAYPEAEHPQNPYADPMGWVSGYSTPKGTRRAWGNGDGRFVYPPVAAADAHPDGPVLEGPVDSIRWEMLRDGIEDYEYFVMLAKLLEQQRDRLNAAQRKAIEKLLEVPPEVSRDMTHFTKDPAPLEAHRRQVAEAIERLTAADR